MPLKGLAGGLYQPLSSKDIATIHEASLNILANIGMTYESGLDETLAMLEISGLKVDHDKSRIYFDRQLVNAQAAAAPEQVVLYNRDGSDVLDLTKHRVYLGTGGAAVVILDLETGEARSTTLNDMYQLARLTDRLDNIHFFVRPCAPTDIPASDHDANAVFACLKGTAKHVMSGVTNAAGVHKLLDIAAMVAGGRDALIDKPFVSVIASYAISPLKLCTQSTLIMLEAVRNRVPVALSAAPMAGSTSPVTMAGTLAQLHAEQLAGITICQLTNPGAPVLYGGIPGRANLRSLAYLGGAVECGMMNAAIHQLAHFIKVPNYNSSGLTDSKIPDAQASWEKALTTVLAAMGGSNYIHHAAGMLESMLAVAYEQYVIDDEIIGMSCKVLEGIPVDAEHLALEAIAEVGPGGSFIMSPHTMAHMRQEYFGGNGVSDQESREKWAGRGSLDARARARDIAKKILAEEETPHIAADVEKAIREKYKILL
jgi:trimethylamine--corrinoid protein Co-methyltransferase